MTIIDYMMRWAATGVAAATIIAGTVAGPANAATAPIAVGRTATDVTLLGCQAASARAVLTFLTGTASTFSCSGVYSPPNRAPLNFRSVGWSGYFTRYGAGTTYFCNNQNIVLLGGPAIQHLYLAPTRASWCQ